MESQESLVSFLLEIQDLEKELLVILSLDSTNLEVASDLLNSTFTTIEKRLSNISTRISELFKDSNDFSFIPATNDSRDIIPGEVFIKQLLKLVSYRLILKLSLGAVSDSGLKSSMLHELSNIESVHNSLINELIKRAYGSL